MATRDLESVPSPDGQSTAERTTTLRKEVITGLADLERRIPRPGIPGLPRVSPKRTTLAIALANLAVGALGSLAPMVEGGRGKVLNRGRGKLFGVFAINPPHALAHLGLGTLGLLSSRSTRASKAYLAASTALFAAGSIAGFNAGRECKGIFQMMGLTMNAADNWLHAVWAGAGAAGLAMR